MAQVRPFIPAREFGLSLAFYQALGFELRFQGDGVAGLDFEGAGLLLQDYYAKEFAENAMHQLVVADLDAWWPRTAGLAERFGVAEPRAPAMQPWGIRVGYVFDPAGVLWHVVGA